MKSERKHRLQQEQIVQRDADKNFLSVLRLVLASSSLSESYRHEAEGYLRARQFDRLLDLADSLGETEYLSATQHYVANQFAALIKKYPFSDPIPGVDPEKKAIEKFYTAERMCKRYNLISTLECKLGRRRHAFVRDRMRAYVQKVIGFTPDLPSIYAMCGFGPGASIGVSGNATHFAAKFLASKWSVTPSALPYARAAMKTNLHIWELLLKKDERPFCLDSESFDSEFEARVNRVDHNKITLVPKTVRVHRTIAVEPLLNGFVQKGVDKYMRQRLFRHGIDLKDQSRNQRLAQLGSVEGSDPFITIDLSNASDSISIALAKDVLPPEWFSFLNAIRSPSYKLNGVVQRYHKFVSMGNGFCFPLETLVFASVCAAAYEEVNLPQDFSVYGDDIIVRQSVARRVLQILHCIGFRHNSDKTFLSGPFRESCGADWYLGRDVRPVTLDYKLDNFRNIIKFHNLTLRNELSRDHFHEVRVFLRSLIPPRWRYCRPYKGDADTAFEVGMDEFMTSPFAIYDRRTWSWKWKEFVTVAISDDSYGGMNGFPTVQMMAALRGSTSEATFTRRRNARTRVRVILTMVATLRGCHAFSQMDLKVRRYPSAFC